MSCSASVTLMLITESFWEQAYHTHTADHTGVHRRNGTKTLGNRKSFGANTISSEKAHFIRFVIVAQTGLQKRLLRTASETTASVSGGLLLLISEIAPHWKEE